MGFQINSVSKTSVAGGGPFFLLTALAVGIVLASVAGFSLPLPVQLQDGLTIFLGIVLEALPFLVLGILVSLLIQRFATTERVQRLMPRHPALALPAMSLLGMVFPVCEC